MTDEAGNGIGHNSGGFNPAEAKGYVRRFEQLQVQIDAVMQVAREECQPIRDDMKQLKKDAAEDGIPKKAFSGVIRERRLRRKSELVRDALSEQHQETFDQIKHALGGLGDTPLGQAALAGHPDAPSNQPAA